MAEETPKSIEIAVSISENDAVELLWQHTSPEEPQPSDYKVRDYKFEVYDGSQLTHVSYAPRGTLLLTEPMGAIQHNYTSEYKWIPYYGANTILKVYRGDKLIFQHRFSDLCESGSIFGRLTCSIGSSRFVPMLVVLLLLILAAAAYHKSSE